MAADRIGTSRGFGLTRTSTGLTDAHVGLIKMLAARAVADFLREVEAAEKHPDDKAGVVQCQQ